MRKKGAIKKCLICGKDRYVKLCLIKEGKGKYCSKKCYGKSEEGMPPKYIDNKGRVSKKRNGIFISCKICEKKIYRVPSQTEKNNYCSRECLYKARLGQNSGENGYQWKGDKVGYFGLHTWVQKKLGKAIKCDNPNCIYPRMMRGKNKMMMFAKRFEWSNISHEYKRDLTDWQQLCTSCHAIYDRGKLIL